MAAGIVHSDFTDLSENAEMNALNDLLQLLTTKANSAAAVLPVGVIIEYGAATAPNGWLICDGSAVSRSTYASLFAIIGETFGAGDSATTFNLPDFQDRVPVGRDSGVADVDTLGNTAGATDVALVAANFAHTHNQTAWSPPGDTGGAYSQAHPNQPTGAVQALSASTHENRPPCLVVNFLIKT